MALRMVLIFAAAGPTFAQENVSADSAKVLSKLRAGHFVETRPSDVTLSGYVDMGYGYNFTGSGNQSVVNSRPATPARGDFNLYALKLVLDKPLTGENIAQAGFRADGFIGEDANYLSLHTYANNVDADSNALYLEQAYVLFRIPVGNGWDWKVGKFLSILGYEALERPVNMNITFSLIFQNCTTLNYLGVLTSYKFDEYLDAKLGVGNGADSDNNTTISGDGDGASVLASLNVTAPGGKANWCHNFVYETSTANNTATLPTFSSYGLVAATNPNGPVYSYNSWGNWIPSLGEDKLLLAFDSFLGTYSPVNGPAGGATTFWGATAYTKYQFNDWFSLASRGAYFGSDNQNKTGLTVVRGGDGSVCWWAYTITAGFQLMDNLLIRAEYRLDWGTNIVGGTSGTPAAPGTPGSGGPAHYAGMEIAYSF